MALIILAAGAGYAYYNKTRVSAYPLDPAINLDGKESIEFVPFELQYGVVSNAISTVTFYKGDYRTISERLEGRVQDIVKANPFLGGWYVTKRFFVSSQTGITCISASAAMQASGGKDASVPNTTGSDNCFVLSKLQTHHAWTGSHKSRAMQR